VLIAYKRGSKGGLKHEMNANSHHTVQLDTQQVGMLGTEIVRSTEAAGGWPHQGAVLQNCSQSPN